MEETLSQDKDSKVDMANSWMRVEMNRVNEKKVEESTDI